jgi:hypothetical protein
MYVLAGLDLLVVKKDSQRLSESGVSRPTEGFEDLRRHGPALGLTVADEYVELLRERVVGRRERFPDSIA